jgi:hypothetical protein
VSLNHVFRYDRDTLINVEVDVVAAIEHNDSLSGRTQRNGCCYLTTWSHKTTGIRIVAALRRYENHLSPLTKL